MLELIGVGFEIMGAAIICGGILVAFVRYVPFITESPDNTESNPYRRLNKNNGLSLLVGLVIFVAADI
ncbi:MAG: hypothetical protein AAF787_17945, partial [Chloroflexota bacterium]